MHDEFKLLNDSYDSRLLLDIGKYMDLIQTRNIVHASGAEIITFAIARTNIGQNPNEPNMLDIINQHDYTLLPNTAGSYNVSTAVTACRLAREFLDGYNLVKVEIVGCRKTLYPNMLDTLKACEELIDDDFKVMAYCNDDPVVAKRLEDLGCVAIMPMCAPIGSGLGIQNLMNLENIIANANVPVIVSSGIGMASDVVKLMEIGCDAVQINTAIARANNCTLMAEAIRKAVVCGRLSYMANTIYQSQATASRSQLEEMVINRLLEIA